MSDSITPFGTTRSIFSLATNDLEINGDITASKFIGSGEKLTNITIKSINESIYNYNNKLNRSLGGTGNNSYINKGILFNRDEIELSGFDTSSNFIWDNKEKILLINNKDIVKDYSNYILKSSNTLSNNIIATSNTIITNIINHIQSNIQIINLDGIPKTSTNNYGLVKVGEGLFVDNEGLITIKPPDIIIIRPDVEPNLTPITIPDTNYEKFVFKYDPDRGTTFDNFDGVRSSVIPYWFNFDYNKIINSSNILSTGYYQNIGIVLNNNVDVQIRPTSEEKYEYTPLNNNYLYFNGTENSYAYFHESFDIYDIYNNVLAIGGNTIGITLSLWFKIDEKITATSKNSILFFSSDIYNDYTIEINIILDPNDNLNKILLVIFNLSQFNYLINTSIELYKWYNLVWCIDSTGKWKVHLNDINKTDSIIDSKAVIENKKYAIKNIGKSVVRNIETCLKKLSISDVRIYNRVLTNVEITELYNTNFYTEYNLSFNDNNYTKCDILLIGGGGGGTNEAGGGAGELIYIENATIDKKIYNVKIGRGGSGKIIKNIDNVDKIIQNNTKGINTQFGELIINGGGSYNINSGAGGSGSGNGGASILSVNYNNFITANNIYYRGNNGYITNGGGGGSQSSGYIINGGDGLTSIIDNGRVIGLNKIFSLSDNNTQEGYYDSNTGSNYFAAGGSSVSDGAVGGIGGGGSGSINFDLNKTYNGLDNSGSGGSGYLNHGFSGGSGIIIVRYLNKEILNTGIKNDIIDTSNILSNRISNLTTDDIDNGIYNRYIVSGIYNGDIIFNSNLQVNGSNAIIKASLTTQNILIENNLLKTALSIKQISNEKILAISNINSEVFTIINNGNIGINKEYPEYTLDIGGNINASSFFRNGNPLSFEISQGMIVQTKHLTYSKTEYKTGNDWEPINNNISNGFVISIKPSDITSKILISIVSHIGMEYSTDSRWWGLRLYRKIGNSLWEHISNADGIIDDNGYGNSCWISHNLGAVLSIYSHFITNVTGSYQDTPNTTETVYYTVYWKNKTTEINGGSLYLNKSSLMLDNNYPNPSSSWTATEIWNKGTSYIAPPQTSQIQINTQYNSVGIDTSPPTEIHKLNVNGNINLINGSYNIGGNDILSSTSNYILSTSNYLINKISELIQRIQILENTR